MIAGWAKDDNINAAYNYFTPVCQTTTTGGIVVHVYVWPVNEAGSINGPLTVFGAMADACRCALGHPGNLDGYNAPLLGPEGFNYGRTEIRSSRIKCHE